MGTTAAQSAAQQLPSGGQALDGGGDAGDRVIAVFGIIVLLAVPVVLGGFALTLPWGWTAVLGGIGLWLGCSWLVPRIAPGQALCFVAADREGTVRVLAGRSRVPAHRRMLDKEQVRRWFLGGGAFGVLITVGGLVGVIVVDVVFLDGSTGYLPLLGLLLTGSFMVAVPVFRGVALPLLTPSRSYRILDSSVVLPLLGLYAKRYGDGTALAGVPADRLLVTLDDATSAEREALTLQAGLMQFINDTARRTA